MKELLDPYSFTFGQLQDIASFMQNLHNSNISMIEFIKYIEQEKKKIAVMGKINQAQRIKSKGLWDKNALKCPVCGSAMNLYPVNSSKGDKIGGVYKSQWQCPECYHDIFSNKQIREWLDGISEKNKSLSC